MKLDWDSEKGKANAEKHGFFFFDAVAIMTDPAALDVADKAHSGDEPRRLRTGRTNTGRLATVRYTMRGDVVRIIGVSIIRAQIAAFWWRQGS